MKMTICFRVDASVQIGSGHVMRCLTLAEAIREKDVTVRFICRELSGNLCGFIESKGYPVGRLPYSGGSDCGTLYDNEYSSWLESDWRTDAEQTTAIFRGASLAPDWLIVDHYALDCRWETQMRSFSKKIMVIDDLADRHHDCDVLLDQNLYENLETRYDSLVPGQCRKLLGPKYVLLRPEFMEARKNMRGRDGCVRRILVFFGGSDPTNETAKALEAVLLLNKPDIALDVVVGKFNPYRKQVSQLCSEMTNTTFHYNVNNMAQMMVRADLAIGAGGTATWERCFLALPAITIVIAQNQLDNNAAVAQAGAAWNLGWHEKVSVGRLSEAIRSALDEPLKLKEMGEKAMEVMEGVAYEGETNLVQLIVGKRNVEAW